MAKVKEIKEWLSKLDDEREVGIFLERGRCGYLAEGWLLSFARNLNEQDEELFIVDF